MRRVSLKRQRQMREEAKLDKDLCERAGGRWEDDHCHGGFCEICGENPDWRGLSRSHLTPRSQGGLTTLENVAMSCYTCHSLRHGMREA